MNGGPESGLAGVSELVDRVVITRVRGDMNILIVGGVVLRDRQNLWVDGFNQETT